MTAQIHECLILDGELFSLACTPPIPQHPRIICVDEDEVNWDDYSPIVFTTACWRRYIGTWEIRDRRFYLTDIEGIYQMTGDEPIFVDEYSGTLRVPFGQRVWVINVEAGCVVDVWEKSREESCYSPSGHGSEEDGWFLSPLFWFLCSLFALAALLYLLRDVHFESVRATLY